MAEFFEQESDEEFLAGNVLEANLGEYEGGRNAMGERHGQGITTLPNGDRYEGAYVDGKRNGEGSYFFANARYTGQYKDGQRNGYGIMHYPDGSKYEGHFLLGNRSGFGKYYYVNGDTYEGAWILDKRDGEGTYTYKDTGSKFKGSWSGGKIRGPGEWIHKKCSFSGNFADGVPFGRGKFLFDHNSEQHGAYVMKDIVQQVDKRMELIGREPIWTCAYLLPRRNNDDSNA